VLLGLRNRQSVAKHTGAGPRGNVASDMYASQRLSGNLPKIPDEMRKNHLSSGFSPQKHGWKAQIRAGEPLGFAHRF
jgi:hypothetical protein